MKDIVKIAESYIGQREKPNNSGFVDPKFEKKMKAVGWASGQAWCAYFAELVWKEAGQDVSFFSASAFKTYLNYEATGKKGSSTPVPGALVVWRSMKNGVAGWTGHIGVVTEANIAAFKAIEGNTNAIGGREGVEVAKKDRSFKWQVNTGLQLVGFIHPEL